MLARDQRGNGVRRLRVGGSGGHVPLGVQRVSRVVDRIQGGTSFSHARVVFLLLFFLFRGRRFFPGRCHTERPDMTMWRDGVQTAPDHEPMW